MSLKSGVYFILKPYSIHTNHILNSPKIRMATSLDSTNTEISAEILSTEAQSSKQRHQH